MNMIQEVGKGTIACKSENGDDSKYERHGCGVIMAAVSQTELPSVNLRPENLSNKQFNGNRIVIREGRSTQSSRPEKAQRKKGGKREEDTKMIIGQ